MKMRIARVTLVSALTAWSVAAQTPRPPAVPQDYVITPFGYFHPSCVQHVPLGATLLADGRIQHAGGSVDQVGPSCTYPRYLSDGSLFVPGSPVRGSQSPVSNGWIENISVTTTTSYGKISATWTTPPQPANNDGQTLFLFPGFEDIDDVQTIVQPVLQYGPSAAGGGSFWAVASWNCCISGVTEYSTLVDVSAGDTILGSISSNCTPGGSSCPTWNVVTADKNTGGRTTLSKTPSVGQSWNWAFGSVLEVYNVVRCGDYPENHGVSFGVQLYDQNLNVISSPAWTKGPASTGITPYCGFVLNSTATRETVEYSPKAANVQ